MGFAHPYHRTRATRNNRSDAERFDYRKPFSLGKHEATNPSIWDIVVLFEYVRIVPVRGTHTHYFYLRGWVAWVSAARAILKSGDLVADGPVGVETSIIGSETSKCRAVGKVICIIYPCGQLANYKTLADPHNDTTEGTIQSNRWTPSINFMMQSLP